MKAQYKKGRFGPRPMRPIYMLFYPLFMASFVKRLDPIDNWPNVMDWADQMAQFYRLGWATKIHCSIDNWPDPFFAF